MKRFIPFIKFLVGFIGGITFIQFGNVLGTPFVLSLVVLIGLMVISFVFMNQKAVGNGILVSLFVILGAFVLLLMAVRCDGKYIYNNHFETPIKNVRRIKAYGINFMGGGSCVVTFKSPEDIVLKDQEAYERINWEEKNKEIFYDYNPKQLKSPSDYSCFGRKDNSKREGSVFCKKEGGKYYFYTWFFD